MTATGTAAPLKFAVDGLKLRLIPPGRETNGLALSVTLLDMLDSGVTFTVAVWDWPAVTVMVVLERLKSGMFTLMKMAEAPELAKFASPLYVSWIDSLSCGVVVIVAVKV